MSLYGRPLDLGSRESQRCYRRSLGPEPPRMAARADFVDLMRVGCDSADLPIFEHLKTPARVSMSSGCIGKSVASVKRAGTGTGFLFFFMLNSVADVSVMVSPCPAIF